MAAHAGTCPFPRARRRSTRAATPSATRPTSGSESHQPLGFLAGLSGLNTRRQSSPSRGLRPISGSCGPSCSASATSPGTQDASASTGSFRPEHRSLALTGRPCLGSSVPIPWPVLPEIALNGLRLRTSASATDPASPSCPSSDEPPPPVTCSAVSRLPMRSGWAATIQIRSLR
jgi:hypothetical protein